MQSHTKFNHYNFNRKLLSVKTHFSVNRITYRSHGIIGDIQAFVYPVGV